MFTVMAELMATLLPLLALTMVRPDAFWKLLSEKATLPVVTVPLTLLPDEVAVSVLVALWSPAPRAVVVASLLSESGAAAKGLATATSGVGGAVDMVAVATCAANITQSIEIPFNET